MRSPRTRSSTTPSTSCRRAARSYRATTTASASAAGPARSDVRAQRPAADDDPESVRFAVVSCQAYHDGYFTALRHLANEEDVDVVFHLGDYLYEYAVDAAGGDRGYTGPQSARPFQQGDRRRWRTTGCATRSTSPTPTSRPRTPRTPGSVTWDDHEVENNYADDIPDGSTRPRRSSPAAPPPTARTARTCRCGRRSSPSGPDLQLYRRLHFGRLAQFDILDTRQYRDDQAHGDGWQVPSRRDGPIRTARCSAARRSAG